MEYYYSAIQGMSYLAKQQHESTSKTFEPGLKLYRVHNFIFEVLEEAKLIYGDRNQAVTSGTGTL